MKGPFLRFVARFLSAVTLSALMLSLPGRSTQVAYALTTTVTDNPFPDISIPDPAAGASCTAFVTRTIFVAASVVIADINVDLNISHSRRSDVRVTLTSPALTTVMLISGAGLGWPVIASPDSYNNYDVTLDDTSVGSLYDNGNDGIGGGIDRTARPFELLSAFKGQNASGNWILRVCDTRNGSDSGVAGTYNLARLTITSADPNMVSGTVFTDYNDNGLRGAGDTGVAGVVVTAYNAAGGVAASATTNALGNYTLSIPNGTQARLEFSSIPATLRPGAFGRDSGTTVQFVTSPAAGVNLGLSKPDEYCQNNPFLAMSCYVNGNPLAAGGSAGAADVLYSIPYSAYGRSDTSISESLATGSQLGATWGLAVQRSTNTLFAAALAKRHTGLGPLGAGGIYAIDVDPITGIASSVSPFVDIATLGIPTGSLGTNFARGLPADSTMPNTDPTAWDAVGKAAIGDMDIGTADDTLWLVNLANRTLYSILISSPTAYATATPITLPGGAPACPVTPPSTNDLRPWAVEVYRGEVYVGVVCSAESTGLVGNLRAYIIKTSETSPGAFSLVFQFPLNYSRGAASDDGPDYPAEWRPWRNQFTSLWCGTCGGSGLAFGNQVIYPQPILSDIEFDTDGDMILGFMDRLGHQTGEANYSTSATTTSFTFYNFTAGYAPTPVTIAAGTAFEGVSAGDILRVCNVSGVFVLENNANCGGIMTGGAGSGPVQGPGGGEYYWQDMHIVSAALDSGTHDEVSLGGLALIPGTDEVAVAAYNPFDVHSGGVDWFSNTTGTRTRGYEIFPRTDNPSRFGNAAGIGDIEGLCYQAPIEIGNRIWLDADGDGVQDAGEAPLPGVTVELYQGGALIASAVTGANGSYYFSSGPGVSTTSHRYLLDALDPNLAYEIRVPNALGGSQQAPLASLILSAADADADQRDSDASYNGDHAIISITTGSAGDNNHTYDFGFRASYSLGNRVWFDTNNDALLNAGEFGIPGVRVELYRDGGTTSGLWDAGDTFLSFDATDAGGYYRFDNLLAGEYVVLIPDDNFRDIGAGDTVPGDPLFGYRSSGTTVAANGVIGDAMADDPDVTATDSDDNGRTTFAAYAVEYVASAAVTLGPLSTEPTADNDPAANPEPGEAPDNRSNRTVDFGFYRVEIGNLVFEDVNGDGVYDALADAEIEGASVQLFALDGATEINVGVDGTLGTADDLLGDFVTGPLGTYNFSGLPQGEYIVRVTPPLGYFSAADTAGTDDPDSNVNDDDNGIGAAGGQVSSGVLTMMAGEAGLTVNETNGTTSDPSLDFGFVRAYSLGNRVWFDTDNNSARDAGEQGASGVLVELYAAGGIAALATTNTDASGYYRFDNLTAGEYVVVVAADNFLNNGSNNALIGYWSSGTSRLPNGTLTESPAPDDDDDSSDTDDNGILQSGAVVSLALTLGPGSDEPESETDLPAGGQGAADNRADMTVDFGFYTMTLGDRVWADANDDGLLGGEIGINNVNLELLSGNGATIIATAVTAGNGDYSFTGLPAGEYIVRIAPDEFDASGTLAGLTSSVGGGAYEPAPDADANTNDNDDNGAVSGILASGGDIRTLEATLTPGAEASSSNASGATNESRVDLGIATSQIYSLGNRVWFDTNNDGARDALNEVGVDGVVLALYAADGSGNPTGPALATTTTAGGGYYRFDNLPADNYVVVIPTDNFTDDGSDDALVGYWSSGTNMDGAGVIGETLADDPDDDDDTDDNGTRQAGGTVISRAVMLGPLSSEATTDDDPVAGSQTGEAADDYSNRTVDFGFYRVEIGNLVFEDVNGDGVYDALADAEIEGASVQLFALDGATEINVGVDGTLGTADDLLGDFVTGPLGTYNFSGLPQGEYIVRVTPPLGYFSAADTAGTDDPDSNAVDDDNGIGEAAGQATSGALTMAAGEAASNITVDDSNGTTTDLTMDFGFVQRYSLGNRVWFDTDNNAAIAAGVEQGISGVRVELYRDDGATSGAYDAGDTLLSSAVTDADGYYRFDDLAAGEYVAVVAGDNFRDAGASDTVPGDPLAGYWSSQTSRAFTGTVTDATSNDPDTTVTDSDDNGRTTFTGNVIEYVASAAVTLGPGSSEPTNDDDPATNPETGEAANNLSNRALDFGFYTMTLGDRVWADANDDGLLGGETGINNVNVVLLSENGVTIIATAVTAGNGDYSFTGLPAGEYIVRIAPTEFDAGDTLAGLTSSIGGGVYEPAPDADANTNDNDDNGAVSGILASGGDIRTLEATLTPGAEASSNNASGATNEPRVDFGIVTPPYSLGNRVWFDTDNDGARDVAEDGADGVVVALYAADGLGNPSGAALQTTATAADGYYRFDGLVAGDYVVVIPAENFDDDGSDDILVGYWSSGTNMDGAGVIGETLADDPDDDDDDTDDNGAWQTSGDVVSRAVTLGPLSTEPTTDDDPATNPEPGEAADNRSNRTVDFGFYRLQLGDLVFDDSDNNGTFSAGDTPLQNATVQLFAADGAAQIPVGADGILNTTDDGLGGVTTDISGAYLFDGLPQGEYIVRVTPPSGYLSAIDSANQADNDDPDTNTDDNDNGDGVLSGAVSSAAVTLTPGDADLINVVTQNNGTTSDPSVDFGFVRQANASGFTKTLLSSNQSFTTDPNVAIGEIVTYRVAVTIPTGTFANAQLVDTMERGLSFMDCVAITSGALATDAAGGFPAICANPTVDDAGGGTSVDVGRRVTFDFGALTNAGAPQTLTIDYRAVVLDSAGNVSGVDLDNRAFWSSSAGTIGPRTTTVAIVESDLSIAKTTGTSVVSAGSVITLTLTIDHTAASETNAYDVFVNDILPAGLDFVPGTLNCNAGAQPATMCAYLAGTRAIEAVWSNFQLGGGNAQVTFDVTALALPATNVANVAWTNLPGAPPSPPGNPPGQQNSNVFSTERDYDPGDPVDVYGANSTLTLNAPASTGEGGGNARVAAIPDTGFAPRVTTDLSEMPLETYDTFAESVWIEIPSLHVKAVIVGVPQKNGAWNVAWLGRQAGWLEGSAFPTLKGNSVVTAHVYLSSGLPGPFINLSKLKYGETVIVHFAGQKYIYEIRSNRVTNPTDASVFRHDEKAWLTLITCKEFDEKTNTYLKRVIVRAVLVKVEADK